MLRTQIINFMKENPNVKITHRLFDSDEYLYQENDGKVYDEKGYLFEDWYSDDRNGMRMRTGGSWEDGWDVYHDNDTCRLLAITDSGRKYLYQNICKGCKYFRQCKYL